MQDGEGAGQPEGLSHRAELDVFYGERIDTLTRSLIDAISASRETEGLTSGERARRFWASVLFARICGFGFAIHRLLPGTPANEKGSIYDSSSVATLCRSLFEAHVAFNYLCDPALDLEEYSLRLLGMQLHDCTRRPSILAKLTGEEPDPRFREQATDLKGRIKQNPAFASKPESAQKKLLKGESAFYLSQDEILGDSEERTRHRRGVYELLSSLTHSFPFSFIRAHLEPDRGTGRENRMDKMYLALAAELGTSILQDATTMMGQLFPEVVPFRGYVVDWNSAGCELAKDG
jgi:hypothetical protein